MVHLQRYCLEYYIAYHNLDDCGCMYIQAQKIVEHALNVFEKLEQVRPTKSSISGFILGQLLAKNAYIEAELALTSQDHDEQVLAACQVFQR